MEQCGPDATTAPGFLDVDVFKVGVFRVRWFASPLDDDPSDRPVGYGCYEPLVPMLINTLTTLREALLAKVASHPEQFRSREIGPRSNPYIDYHRVSLANLHLQGP